MPAISVIIPVYNVEPYLRECLDSVVNQTFRDIEIICVNDGSTDGSPAILEEYAAKDSRIIIIHQQNGGLSAARNSGMNAAKGDFILFVDSDDYIKQNTLEITYNAAIESGAEMVMFCIYNDKNFAPAAIKAPCSISEPVTDLLSKMKLVFFQGPSAWKWLYKKTYLDRMNLWFIKGLIFEDVPFVLNAALHSNYIKVIPYHLYFYREHLDTITKKRNRNHCDYSCLSYKLALESVKDLSLSDECLWILYNSKLA
ncbi:MAG: glycosyltransferase family 2 protein, partial [Thermoguttaceae bacterium]|nr:glycosyltransferase family 2 protein [Thermoguttaceae bacterium]